ncbi:MAG: hypothetical protein ABIA76_02875 [Candidatus Diapherotrites archaeon]
MQSREKLINPFIHYFIGCICLSNLKEWERPAKKCLNCGEVLVDYNSRDLYTARFCSDKCREDFFSHKKK